MTKYLFVYGTLRGGLDHPESKWLSAHSEFLGAATAKGKLYRIGWYPGLVESQEEKVVGELLLMDDPEIVLERLDIYEGVAEGEYERKEVEVIFHEEPVKAWVYFFLGNTSDLRWIPTGDFLEDLNSHFD